MAKMQEQNAQMRGFIISYNSENGYGFVRGEDMQDYYFNIRAFKENALPQVSQKVVFELSNKPAKEGKNSAISWLKYDENATTQANGKATNAQSNDSRVICPHCGAKVMPRVVILNAAPYSSHCPICGGKIKQFQNNKLGCLIIFIIFLVISSFTWLPFVWAFISGLFNK